MWVVDLDIESFFDQVNVHRLTALLREKISSRELRQLLWSWLEQQALTVERVGLFRQLRRRGILQGGILSPLFANVYLDQFDKMAIKQGLKHIRYADDILIFKALASLLKPELGFRGRRHRPAPDPVNALLSLGYTLLYNQVYSWIHLVGLDPYCGFFHQLKRGHASLASDLMSDVAYDIPDDRRRARLYKKLKNFGKPVQLSVFECTLSRQQFRQLVKIVERLTERETDLVRYYVLCPACCGRVSAFNAAILHEEPALFI